MFSVAGRRSAGTPVTITVLIALLVCLIPTTIGGLLSAIGVAGMSRMMQANVIATSGRAVEAAGDVDVLLLDKTGTITLGNRQASAFLPAPGVTGSRAGRCRAAGLAGRRDAGRAQHRGAGQAAVQSARARSWPRCDADVRAVLGADPHERRRPAGSRRCARARPMRSRPTSRRNGGRFPKSALTLRPRTSRAAAARRWWSPRSGPERRACSASIELKDIVKGGIKERFAELRSMGITTIMITGDNRLTAAAIAAEAGVDDFLAEATPEAKLKLIREHQAEGRLVAMTGDGTNDAPALAQADVAVAMNTGTQAAKEAGNMVDLDSNPTKLIEIVEIGKQMLMTRGSLTTFSIANDVAKYFAIIPAAFVTTYPQLKALNVMHLASPARRSCRR